jgi:MFS family permease
MSSPATGGTTVPQYAAAYRWNIILMLSAAQVIAYISRVNVSVAAPLLIKQYHYTPATIGVLLSMFSWAYTFALLPSGPFVDWVKAKVGYPVGVGLWSIGTVLCGTTVAFVPLTLFRMLVGVGEGPLIPAGQRIIFETFPKEKRASVVAMFFAGNKIGLTLGMPLSAVVLYRWGLSWVFYVTGALGFVWIAWFLLTYRGVGRSTAAKSNIGWATLLKYRTTWGIMLGNAGYLYIYFVFATWLPGYLVLQRKMSILKSGFVGMLPFMVGVVVTIFGGWMADRLVASGYRVTVVRKGMTVGGLFAATVFTLLGAYTSGLWMAVTMLTLAIASFSMATGSIMSVAVDVAPPHIVSSLVSLQNFGGNIGGSLAPIVTGLLISSGGNFQLALIVTAAVALVFGCGCFGLIVGNLDADLAEQSKGAPA